MTKILPNFQKGDTTNLLQELTNGLLRGGECIGFESIDVTDAATKTLTVPGNATYALIAVEADGTAATPSLCMRWRMDGVAPTAALGMPIGHLGELEIKNLADLGNFEIIGIEVGKTHKVRVSYFE